MCGQVETEYVFHMEDDWVFNRIPNFVHDSMSILRSRPRPCCRSRP